MFDDYGRSDRDPLLERSLYEAGYQDGFNEGHRKGEESIRRLNTLSMNTSEALKQYSKKRIVELAMYWYEEALYWQDECRKYKDLMRKIKAMEGVL